MNPVRAIADAVLYEGYLLWPYRRSALKNRRRWTIGGLYPRAYAERSGERWRARAEVLLEGPPGARDVRITLRFLHLVERQVLRNGRPVDELRIGTELFQSWQEAREREVTAGSAARTPFTLPAGSEDEPIGDGALLRRSWRRVDGEVEVAVTPAGEGVARVTVQVRNAGGERVADRDDAVRAGLLCAHVSAVTAGGAFVSSIDPPERLAGEAGRCRNDGLWPVLVGAPGSRDTVLAAPIVLYDWPQVAPESPGDLFDATEIDRLLVQSVLSLTDDERAEMAAADPRAREILRRCAGMTPEDLLALHGTRRDPGRDVW